MENPIKASREELKEILAAIKGTKIAELWMETTPDMLKGGRGELAPNPFVGKLLKQSHMRVKIGGNYGQSVTGRRVSEANPQTVVEAEAVESYQPEKRAWGQRILGTPLVEHKGSFYLDTEVLSSSHPTFVVVDGDNKRPLTDSEAKILEPYLKQYNPSKDAVRQGLQDDNAVVVRTVKLDSVVAIKLVGQEGIVVG